MPERISVRNPRTGDIDYWISLPLPDQVRDRILDLRAAQLEWNELSLAQRIEALCHWKEALLSQKNRLVEVIATDTGRWGESVLEVDLVCSSIDRWCQVAPTMLSDEGQKSTTVPFLQLESQYVPYQVVGVISPWNFPLLLSCIDAIPALLCGCAVIVKPSEVTPRFIQPLIDTITTVPGLRDIFAFTEGAGETGATIVEHVDLICFTGSLKIGRLVGEAAARRFIPAFLELGGKDPAIVLSSADVDMATSAILWGSVVNAGQSCLSIERVYVADTIYDDVVHQLIDKAEQVTLSYPTYKDGPIGPLINAAQAEVIADQLQDAVQKGAVIHCGGSIEKLGGGLWCRPTVLTRVNHSMKVMTDETFGPLIPVMPFSTPEEAIHLANDSKYGLSAAVFGDETEARAVAKRLEAGAVSINDACLTSVVQDGEKNSFKFSGLGGSRMGPTSIFRFLRKKALILKNKPLADPWWFDVLRKQ